VCGMAGGSPKPVFNGGEYTPTVYGKQGDLGSQVLKPRPTGIVWRAGSVVNVSWYQLRATSDRNPGLTGIFVRLASLAC
jgi:hypothetical protein